MKRIKKYLRFIEEYWIRCATVALAIIIASFFVEVIIFKVENWHGLNVNDSLSYTIFGLFVGLLTFLGVGLTHKQLDLAEDKIESYKSFYKAAIKLLKDDDGDYLYFSGSTLVPGHITYGDETYVGKFGHYAESLTERAKELYKKKENKQQQDNKQFSKFILPQDFNKSYKRYEGKSYKNYSRDGNFDGNDIEAFKRKIEEVKYLKKVLSDHSEIRYVDLDEHPFINSSFYLSNGKAMIYAMAFRYEQADIMDNEEELPFVGFQTKNKRIIEAFEKRFTRQWAKLLYT